MFSRIKESIDKGIVSVSVKSSTYMETEKLKAKSGNVTEKMEGIIHELGAGVYSQWKAGTVDNGYIEQMCMRLKGLEDTVKEYQRQIEELEQEKEKILTGDMDDGYLAGQEGAVRCVCGRWNPPGAKFCTGCGKALEREAEDKRSSVPAICSGCGRELEAGAKFCGGCGKAVSE